VGSSPPRARYQEYREWVKIVLPQKLTIFFSLHCKLPKNYVGFEDLTAVVM
jgi:hypothetical protein